MNARFFSGIIFILILAVIGVFFYFFRHQNPHQASNQFPKISINNSSDMQMKLTSPAFEDSSSIPAKYTCDGENINPPLKIASVPMETKSLALILDDPDAPAPGGFVHWVVFNFDPKTTGIDENGFPSDATQGQNGAGQSRYTGPCPPSGTHRYFFKLYALDSPLDLDSSAKREDVLKAMTGHILEQAELIGLYRRP